jgi:hypothetical protein
VTIALQVKLILWSHENQANDIVDLWQLRQQTLAMQMAYDKVVSPATIAKAILDEFKGFNPFKLLKYFFWYCSSVFSFYFILVKCCTALRQLLGLRAQASSSTFKKKKKRRDMWGADRCIE